MQLLAALMALGMFSAFSFWQGKGVTSCVLWLLTAAISTITGLFFFDTYGNYLGVTFSLVLFAYGVFCLAHAYLSLMRNAEE